MNPVKQQCIVSDRGSGWSEGVGFTKAASGADAGSGAGGPAVKTKTGLSTGGATIRMKRQFGRRNSKEVHHADGPVAIKAGSTNPPR